MIQPSHDQGSDSIGLVDGHTTFPTGVIGGLNYHSCIGMQRLCMRYLGWAIQTLNCQRNGEHRTFTLTMLYSSYQTIEPSLIFVITWIL